MYDYLKNKVLKLKNINWKGYGSKKQKYYDNRDRRIELKITYPIQKPIKKNIFNKKGDINETTLKYSDYNKISKLGKLNKKSLKRGEKTIAKIGDKIRVE